MPKYFFYLLIVTLVLITLVTAGYWLESEKGIKPITAEYTPIIIGSLFFIIWVFFVFIVITMVHRRSDISKFLTFMTVERVQKHFFMGRRYFGQYRGRHIEIFYRPAMRNSPAKLEITTPCLMPYSAVFYSSRFLFRKTNLENRSAVQIGGKKIRVKADSRANADRLFSLSVIREALEFFVGITPRFGHFILWIDPTSLFLQLTGLRIKLDRIEEIASQIYRLDRKN